MPDRCLPIPVLLSVFKNERLWLIFTTPRVDRMLDTGLDHRTVETPPPAARWGWILSPRMG